MATPAFDIKNPDSLDYMRNFVRSDPAKQTADFARDRAIAEGKPIDEKSLLKFETMLREAYEGADRQLLDASRVKDIAKSAGIDESIAAQAAELGGIIASSSGLAGATQAGKGTGPSKGGQAR